MITEKYLTEDDVQNMLQICRSTLFRLRQEGMPYHKIGSKIIRYKEEEINDWLESNTQKPKNTNETLHLNPRVISIARTAEQGQGGK